MIKIIIADDHVIVRQGLRQILAGMTDMELVAEAKDAPELLELLRWQHCHVVVLDVSMPGRNGLEALTEIKNGYPHVAVLILTMHTQDQYAVRALKAGAAGYLTKDSVPTELITAIRRIAAGGKYITAALAETLADYLGSKTDKAPHERLSDREYEVLCKIGAGKTASEIAEELFLSPNTIGTYRSRLLEKLHLRNNAELIHYAITNRLID